MTGPLCALWPHRHHPPCACLWDCRILCSFTLLNFNLNYGYIPTPLPAGNPALFSRNFQLV